MTPTSCTKSKNTARIASDQDPHCGSSKTGNKGSGTRQKLEDSWQKTRYFQNVSRYIPIHLFSASPKNGKMIQFQTSKTFLKENLIGVDDSFRK